MAYNKQYNTRNSGRFNTPGHFVPATEQPSMAQQTYQNVGQRGKPMQTYNQNQNHNQTQNYSQPQIQNQNLQSIQTVDIDMKPAVMEVTPEAPTSADGTVRPHWMKPKLPGVKKVSNKERRRRQNESLRKLLTPKNALMVLNEMLPNEQLANQFKVEPAGQFQNQYYNSKQGHSFCADLTVHGNTYKGYGDNKLTARNVAAEQAIRDIIIQKMNKVLSTEVAGTGMSMSESGDAEGSGAEDEEALPMIQLASFALHKLFSEWEYEGHKVPQLKPTHPSTSVSETGSETGSTGATKPRAPKKKELPANAGNMHPCMLLTYMRPHLEYKELAVDGCRPQNIVFTLGVEVDGSTYLGKASNKKEARKLAAKSACQELFGVTFADNPTDNAPQVPA